MRRNAGTGGKRFANRSNVDVLPLKQTLFDIKWLVIDEFDKCLELGFQGEMMRRLDFIAMEYSYNKNG